MLRLSDIARAFKPAHRGAALLRRDFLKLGALGLALPQVLALRALGKSSSPAGAKAKSCIVLFAWGGISHLDTWDLKPDASSDIRGEFRPINTSADGVQMSEHLPLLARQAHHLAIVQTLLGNGRAVCRSQRAAASAAMAFLTSSRSRSNCSIQRRRFA